MGRQFDFGRAFGHMFSLVWRNAGVLVVIGYFLAIITLALYLGMGLILGLSGASASADGRGGGAFAVVGFLTFALQGLALAFQTAVVSWLAMKPPEERAPFWETFRGAFAVGMRQFLPVSVIAVLSVVPIFLASLLFIIPGVILRLVWYVAVPAQANENVGVFAAFGRSAELTRDNRLVIFGFSFVSGIVLVIALYGSILVTGLVATAVIAPLGRDTGDAAAMAPLFLVLLLLGMLIMSALITLAICLLLSGPAAVYRELRLIKDPPAKAIASVFA